MSPQTAHSCEGLGGAGPLLVEGVGDCSGRIPPGDELAEEDAEGCGGATTIPRSLGDSLLLVDSDLWSGNDARRCLGDKAVVTCSSAMVLEKGGNEYVSCWIK